MASQIAKAFFLITIYFILHSNAFEQLSHIKSTADVNTQQQAVHDLIARLLPDFKDNFIVKVDPNIRVGSTLDKFLYVTANSKLSIRCTSGVACAMGINHFLKYYCKAHISWSGDQLNIPKKFPEVEKVVSIEANTRLIYVHKCVQFVYLTYNNLSYYIITKGLIGTLSY